MPTAGRKPRRYQTELKSKRHWVDNRLTTKCHLLFAAAFREEKFLCVRATARIGVAFLTTTTIVP
jgi:hypothetical protein